mmetsp:Transcript_51558/g.95390  ORF Transcript_51558/g.95390 Transcript_51558/m.95390 type:complete len:239 (-) Transcript_51558:127-843(-)
MSLQMAPVLCFGDSLTAGYHGVWQHPLIHPSNPNKNELSNVRFHPYAYALGAELFLDRNPERRKADSEVFSPEALTCAEAYGYSGFCADELLPKLECALKAGPWRCCVVLAGSNDIIGGGCSVEVTLERIKALYAACERAAVPVVVLVNTDCDTANHGMVPAAEAGVRRQRLRDLGDALVKFSQAKAWPCCDVRDRFRFPQSAEDPSAELWDDSLHYSPKGSQTLGALVAQTICTHSL